ncbi:hypothetical protein SAMN04487962_1662 [Marinobacter segnicrescens]|uniref:Uncharacterized protein n=1 Tax=Marinobacter segnicrescens TaxID=430453 RepID=A0A1I0IGF3_9GAMM|nr:hypothetical protein [Marinobacter segnicrescens]SET95377.1 hypothetical protein SAMN04487962_1662 [Marinobacter segnicrescens]
MNKNALRALSFALPAVGALLTSYQFCLGQGQQGPAFKSYSEVWQTSVPNSGYVYAIALGTILWVLAQVVWWKRFHGTFKADSLIARKAPEVPGMLIPVGVGFGYFPITTVNLLTTLLINSVSFATDARFYAFPNLSIGFESIFIWSVLGTFIFFVAIPLFGALTSADPKDVYFAGSHSLRASISDNGRRWKVHFHPSCSGPHLNRTPW